MLYGKDRSKSNPIPYRLYPKEATPSAPTPLVPSSSVPAAAILQPRSFKQHQADVRAHNPVNLLAASKAEDPARFPKNLRIQNFVDSREKWVGVPTGKTRSVLMRVIRRH